MTQPRQTPRPAEEGAPTQPPAGQTPETVALPRRPVEETLSIAGPGPAPSPEGPTIPAQLPAPFGRYQLLKVLGKGGMGAVYLAHDPQLDRFVALKVPFITTADGPAVLERFYREARAAATVLHPNVCPVYDVGEVNGVPYLTMGYIEGKPLADFVQGKPPTPGQSAVLVRRLALALQEAHLKGVIHRDLKPSNVMIDRRGQPVVMDFGLARRSRRGDVRLTHQGDMMGTPAYMPPEQVSGDVDAMGPASDVYSLGVILYELLAGRLPFGGDMMAMLSHVLLDEPPPPSQFRPDLDPELEAICLQAMAKKPADRYASMAELAAALLDYQRHLQSGEQSPSVRASPPPAAETKKKGTDIHASQLGGLRSVAQVGAALPAPKAPDRGRRKRRPPRRRRRVPWWAWAAAATGVALLAVGGFLLVKTVRARRGAQTQTAGTSSGSRGTQAHDEEAKRTRLTPPPRPRLVYSARATSEGKFQIFRVNEDGSDPRPLTDGRADDEDPAWSPDGTRIAFTSDRSGAKQVWVMQADGTNARQLTSEGVNSCPSWSPEGTRLAFTASGGAAPEVYVMNADGSEQTNLTQDPALDADAAWSPDGGRIAFTSGRAGFYRVFVMAPDGKDVRDLLDADTNTGGVYPAWAPDGTKITYKAKVGKSYELYVIDAEGDTAPRRLTDLGGINQLPCWSPDGKRIAFQHREPGSQQAVLYVVDADGNNPKELLKAWDGGRISWEPPAGGAPVPLWRPKRKPANTLTAREQAQSWKLLFDGRTLTGWRGYNRKSPEGRWAVEDGTLSLGPKRGVPLCGLVTEEEYGDFELAFEWRVSRAGNSGVLYRVAEGPAQPFFTGPEYQILDNVGYPGHKKPEESAASCFGLYGPPRDVTRPAGQWNRGRIVVAGNHVEHWLNGIKVVSYDLGSADWRRRLRASSFRTDAGYGKTARGRIVLQDQGSAVAYRNVKIRIPD